MSVRYELLVDAVPSSMLQAALEGFEMTFVEGSGLRLVGSVADQAALYGALHRLQDLQVEIIELRRVDSGV
jgi:hypothetical protein